MKLGGRIDISIVFLCIVRILSLLLIIPHDSYFMQVNVARPIISLSLLGGEGRGWWWYTMLVVIIAVTGYNGVRQSHRLGGNGSAQVQIFNIT